MTNKKTDYFTLRIEKSVKDKFTEFCQRRRLPISRAVTLFVYVDGAIRSQFADVCAGYGVSVGTVIRGFMMACVENNNFPYKPSRPKKNEK